MAPQDIQTKCPECGEFVTVRELNKYGGCCVQCAEHDLILDGSCVDDDDDFEENAMGRIALDEEWPPGDMQTPMAIDDAPPEIQDAYWGYTKE